MPACHACWLGKCLVHRYSASPSRTRGVECLRHKKAMLLLSPPHARLARTHAHTRAHGKKKVTHTGQAGPAPPTRHGVINRAPIATFYAQRRERRRNSSPAAPLTTCTRPALPHQKHTGIGNTGAQIIDCNHPAPGHRQSRGSGRDASAHLRCICCLRPNERAPPNKNPPGSLSKEAMPFLCPAWAQTCGSHGKRRARHAPNAVK